MADAHSRPGEPPEIRDEAADTPMWVPAVGLALLVLGAVFLVWQAATDEAATDEAEAVEVEAAEGAGDAEGADEAAEEPAGDVQ